MNPKETCLMFVSTPFYTVICTVCEADRLWYFSS